MKIWKSPILSPTPYWGCPSMMIATSARGAADVEAHAALDAADLGHVARADDARRGAGQDHLHAFALALLGRHHAAIRLREARVGWHAGVLQAPVAASRDNVQRAAARSRRSRR